MNNLEALRRACEYMGLELEVHEPWADTFAPWALHPSPFQSQLGEGHLMGPETRRGRVLLRFNRRLTPAQLAEIRRHRPLGTQLIIEDSPVDVPVATPRSNRPIGNAISTFRFPALLAQNSSTLVQANGFRILIHG